MALDPAYFQQKCGVAVILFDHSLAGSGYYDARFFLGWATKRSFMVDASPGTYSIELWLICGTSSGFDSVKFQGGGTLTSIMQARR
ncbi:MAG: hypothetical protein WCP77_16715 [Roseococcus sp.]|jgi:hypothetical protein